MVPLTPSSSAWGRLSAARDCAPPLNRAVLRSNRGGSHSRCSGRRAWTSRGRRSGRTRRCCTSCPRARHGHRPMQSQSDRLQHITDIDHTNLDTNLDTTQIHYHAYRKNPTHLLPFLLLRAFASHYYHYTTPCHLVLLFLHSSLCYQLCMHIPIPLRSGGDHLRQIGDELHG